MNVEHTDLSIAELELLVARKFTTTLEKRKLYNFSDDIQTAEEPADVIVKRPDHSPLLIQITEIVDEDTRYLFETRSKFTTALYGHKTIVKQFCGCLVNIITSHDEPKLPIDTDSIIAQITEIGEKIGTLQIGMERFNKLYSPAVTCS